MTYPVPSFEQMRQTIIGSVENDTGLTISDDDDVAIRADGTAAVGEGLYDFILWVLRQLFIRTADEQGLVLHAIRLNLPRLGSSLAVGQVTTIGSTSAVDLPIGSKLTDGSGYYWTTTADVTLIAGQAITVPVQAQAVGASWNKSANTILTWTSPVSGQQPSATVVMLSGGSDGEALEAWRTRLDAAEKLGPSQGRSADFIQAALAVPGVLAAYPYPKRRGVGSFDVCVVAVGSDAGGDLPSPALLAAVQAACIAVSVASEDIVAFAANQVVLNLSAVLTGINIDTSTGEAVMTNYVAQLQPGQNYIEEILASRLIGIGGVSDVALTPVGNQVAVANWMRVDWFRPGVMTASLV